MSAEDRLDALLRPVLIVEPPPELQATLLANVLAAADRLETPEAKARGVGRTVPLVAYALLGIVVALYAAVVAGLWADAGPLGELLDALPILLSLPVWRLVPNVVDQLASQAVWLLVLPVIWYLWDRDRAEARQP